jgi:DNA-nicking Smr family endonuclease
MGFEISDEDKELFRNSVARINDKPKKQQPSENTGVNSAWRYGLSDAFPKSVSAEAQLSYCESGVSAQRFKQLQAGQLPWEAKLDLHGARFDSAANILCTAIENFTHQHIRVALIIHGKGGRFGQPILKNYVHHWLKQLPQVLAFHSALPKDGGSGALYVLLKR